MNVVVGQRTSIFKLLASKDQTLLVRRDSFFILDLRFDIVDRVGRLDFKRDGLARKSLYETRETGDISDGRGAEGA